MAIAVEQSLTGTGTSTSIALTSWTPGANELVLVGVALRDETISVSVSGNSLTFVEIADVDNVQSQCGVHLFRALGASPTAGPITVTLTGNSKPAAVVAARFSGVDTSGTNGSGAIEATETHAGPDPDNDDMFDTITTLTDNAWALAMGCHRVGSVFTVPFGEIEISINNISGSGGDLVRGSMWYDVKESPGIVFVGGFDDLSSSVDWCMITVSVKPAAAGGAANPKGPLNMPLAGPLGGPI